MIKVYSDQNVSILSAYAFIFVILCMIQKLYIETPWSIYRDFKVKNNRFIQISRVPC